MKVLVLAYLLALAAISVFADDEKVVDDFDFETMFKNKDQWKAAFNCLMDKAPCGDLQELKEGVTRRFHSNCSQCTPNQLEKYNQTLKMLQEKYPEDYKVVAQLIKKE